MTESHLLPPEILAPAGNEECLLAAIENGADAVYFGLAHGFNARARAGNFEIEHLPKVMAQLHRSGVLGYVTLNTLVFSDELDEIAKTIEHVARAGVDAVLVQDLGVARMIRVIAPDLPIHASTQMTMTSGENINAIQQLGVERVVLARELSIEEIRHIRQTTATPVEVFVHGALCVAYSGQCLTSESLGGRSANRGQCAQACRLPYELICDGDDVDLERVRYLLSPQDLAAFKLVPDLIDAGVCSLKIEGRLKTPEYVANITKHYRQAVDAYCEGQAKSFTQDEVQEMELSFSRGFSHGWLEGCDHKELVPGESSAKRGVLAGEVLSFRGPRIKLRLNCTLQPGDGILFEPPHERENEQGGRLQHVFRQGRVVKKAFADQVVEIEIHQNKVDVSCLEEGQRVWKTDDPQLTKKWRKSYTQADAQRRLPIDFTVRARVGEPLQVTVQSPRVSIDVVSEGPLELARKHPLTVETLKAQFGRLGATTFQLRALDADIEGDPMVPLSVLGEMRKELIKRLNETLDHVGHKEADASQWRSALTTPAAVSDSVPQPNGEASPLVVLCRTQEQLEAMLESNVREVYADFHDIREYRNAVDTCKGTATKLWLGPTRIQKPKEMGLIRKIVGYGADGILARNFATIQYCIDNDVDFVSDFSLNVTNEISFEYLQGHGPTRITPSYDMNREQLTRLVEHVPAEYLEIVIHQHMPMFHMEHCVFCSLLSPGTNKTNCGRPCDEHVVKMRDRVGKEHPLHADVACRNTLYNATAQSGAEVVHELARRAVGTFRVELLEQNADQAKSVIDLYRRLLAGEITGTEVWRQLRASNRVGVTRGTLEEPRNPLAIL